MAALQAGRHGLYRGSKLLKGGLYRVQGLGSKLLKGGVETDDYMEAYYRDNYGGY